MESGMDMPTSGKEVQSTSDAPGDGQENSARTATRTPSIIVGIVAAVVVALSVYYLLRPEPLLVQGEADATRLDIAARVDGRVKEIPVERGQNIPAGRAQAAVVLGRKTFDRTQILTGQGNAPQARLDQMTDSLHESERAADQAKSAYEQAVNGYTKEGRAIAKTQVDRA